jgi:hypothetical protein
MPDLEAVELLTQAKERLFKHGWADYHTSTGPMCLEYAVSGEHGLYIDEVQENRPDLGPVFRRIDRYLREATGLGYNPNNCLFEWNDCQESAGPVFNVIDVAIALAKESSPATV